MSSIVTQPFTHELRLDRIAIFVEDLDGRTRTLDVDASTTAADICGDGKLLYGGRLVTGSLRDANVQRDATLTVIEPTMFSNLGALSELSLGSNALSVIEPTTFSNLTALTTLDLSENALATLGEYIYSDSAGVCSFCSVSGAVSSRTNCLLTE